MKPLIPLSALLIYLSILWLINLNIIPDPIEIINYIKNFDSQTILILMFLVILLESIIYIWFYLPGQFIAVLLVLSYSENIYDILYLTLISIIAVTIWAFINYYLWYFISKNKKTDIKKEDIKKINYKKLLFSMIHINTIALFIFDQWIKKAPKKIIYITWLLNIPYYFLIILITFLLKDEVMSLSENSYIVIVLLIIWLLYSLYINKFKFIK